MRKAVMIAAAVLLVLEGLGLAAINWIMGLAVDRQRMSLAGLDPDAMSMGAWVLGGVAALFLVAVAVVLLRAGLRARPPGRFGRFLVVACAVVHALLGAATVGLVGWAAFAGAMVVLALLVFAVLLFGEETKPKDPGQGNPQARTGPAQAGA